MANGRREALLTLLAKVDEQTIRRSIASTRQLEDAQEDLAQAAEIAAKGLGGYGTAARKAVGEVRRYSAAAQLNVQALARIAAQNEKVEKSEKDLARSREKSVVSIKAETDALYDELDVLRKAEKVDNQGASGGSAGDLGKVERGFSSVGQILPGGGGDVARVLADITGAADDLKPLVTEVMALAKSGPIAAAAMRAVGISGGAAATGAAAAAVGIVAITAAAGALAVVGIALVAVVKQFTKQLEEQKAVLDGAIGAQRRYYELIQTGTSETIRAELEATQVRIRAAEMLRQDIQNTYDALSPIERLAPPAAQLKKELEELNTEVRIGQLEIDKLTEALGSNEVKARDAAAAQAEAANQTEAATKPLIAARHDETAAIEKERAALEQLNANREAQMADRRSTIQATVKYNQDLAALEEQIAADRVKITRDSAAKIAEINTKLKEQISALSSEAQRENEAAITALNQQIADIQRESGEAEIKYRVESAARIEDLTERHNRELQRIQQDYNDAARDAIFNRDAVALDAAQRNRKRAIDEADQDLNDGVAQERESLQIRLAEQRQADEQRIRELQEANARESEARHIALEQRLADLHAAAQAEIEITHAQTTEQLAQLQQRLIAERDALQSAYQQQLAALLQHLAGLVSANSAGLGAIANQWNQFFSGLSAGINNAMSSSVNTGGGLGSSLNGGSSSGSSGGGLGSSNGFATGVRDFRGGLALVGERGPELAMLANGTNVYSNEDTKKMLGGMRSVTVAPGAVQISTQGTDSRSIAREIERKLPAMLTKVIEGLV